MIAELRREFNQGFAPEKYTRFLRELDDRCGTHVAFRNSETPCFFPSALIGKMVHYGRELIQQLALDPEYRDISSRAIPAAYKVSNEALLPLFVQVDFGIDANLEPKLVEIQGFPSLYAYQPVLAETYQDIYGLQLPSLLVDGYWERLKRAIVADCDPAEVVLLELDPTQQKTYGDFLLTAERCGIRIVSLTDVRKEGNRLFEGDKPIRRIYNRVIVDELERKGIDSPFDWRDDLDVEWAGHPNWYFRISKFSLPYLKHPSVPETFFLHDVKELPDDLENWVLKPLYSFAGLGVKIGPTREEVAAADPENYILQRRVDFQPVIETPFGLTKAEVRVMYLWQDELRAVTTIIRMGRGKMMGVDQNRDMEWVGASAGLIA